MTQQFWVQNNRLHRDTFLRDGKHKVSFLIVLPYCLEAQQKEEEPEQNLHCQLSGKEKLELGETNMARICESQDHKNGAAERKRREREREKQRVHETTNAQQTGPLEVLPEF